MKTNSILLSAIFSLIVASCDQFEVQQNDGLVPVEVNFSAFDVSMESDVDAAPATRATAKESAVSHLAFKVFDSKGKQVVEKYEVRSAEADNFEQFEFSLPMGSYTFVAVAHKAPKTEQEHVSIESATKAELPITKAMNTYAKVTQIEIDSNTKQSVTMDFGYRITSSIAIKVTDETPANVEECEITINPSLSASKSYTINPTTGFVAQKVQSYSSASMTSAGLNTFTNISLKAYTYLTSESEEVDVKIDMKSSKGDVLFTRTLTNIPMKRYHTTIATGRFFSSSVEESFTFASDPEKSLIEVDLMP